MKEKLFLLVCSIPFPVDVSHNAALRLQFTRLDVLTLSRHFPLAPPLLRAAGRPCLAPSIVAVAFLSPFCTQSPDKILRSRIDESFYLHYGRALTASHCRSGRSWHVSAQSRPQKHMHSPEPIASRISLFSRGSSARATLGRRAGGADGRDEDLSACQVVCVFLRPSTLHCSADAHATLRMPTGWRPGERAAA